MFPWYLFFFVDFIQELLQSFCFLFGLVIDHEFHQARIFLGDFNTGWLSVGDLHAEHEVGHVLRILICIDFDLDLFGALIMVQSFTQLNMFVVLARRSSISFSVKFYGLDIKGDLAGASVTTNDLQGAELLSSNVLVQVTLIPAEHTWLIVVNNDNGGAGINSVKALAGVGVVELDVEVLIRLPIIIVKDLNRHILALFVAGESKDLIDRFVVVVFLGVSVDSAHTNFTFLSSLVEDLHVDVLGGLTHGVVQAQEAPTVVLLLLGELGGKGVLGSEDLVLDDGLSLTVEVLGSSSSVLSALNHVLTSDGFAQQVLIDVLDLVGLESSFEEFLHFGNFLDFVGGHNTVVLLDFDEGVVEVHGFVDGDWLLLLVILLVLGQRHATVAFSFLSLHFARIDLVGNEGANDHNDEESEGEDTLGHSHGLVSKHEEHPDVCEETTDSSNRKYAQVVNLLDSLGHGVVSVRLDVLLR